MNDPIELKQAIEYAHAILEMVINKTEDESTLKALCAVNHLLAESLEP